MPPCLGAQVVDCLEIYILFQKETLQGSEGPQEELIVSIDLENNSFANAVLSWSTTKDCLDNEKGHPFQFPYLSCLNLQILVLLQYPNTSLNNKDFLARLSPE
ncbi:hypothetical protein CEXT_275611 [Caerostris extrusa]|uniref:Uncharacterized protein n=1 Tax=Caerostris extrusa TaxID=172846 RepID=A0AAV4PHG4_CAEEX|nr:hypothetical protein CEXT_275611 [Caerostris extrusa]